MHGHFGPSITAVLAAAAMMAAGAESLAAPGDLTVLNTLPSPHPSPDGLDFDGQVLWVSDCESSRVFRLDPSNGQTVDWVDFSFMVDHLDHRGDHLWLSDHTNFYRADVASLEITSQTAGPWATAMGVAEEGEGIWSADPAAKLIHKIDGSGQILATLPTPGSNPCGLAWDGRCLWVSDLTDKRYYQIDPADGSVELSFVAPPAAATTLPTGIAFHGDRVWVVDEDPDNPKIYEVAFEPVTEGPCALPVDPDPPDAGPPPKDDGPGAQTEDSGCSLAPSGSWRGGPGGWAGALLSALLGAAARIRRHRARPG